MTWSGMAPGAPFKGGGKSCTVLTHLSALMESHNCPVNYIPLLDILSLSPLTPSSLMHLPATSTCHPSPKIPTATNTKSYSICGIKD